MINYIMNATLIIFIIIWITCIFLYLPRMKAWFAAIKKQQRIYNDKKNKIALIIPARNESKIIMDIFNNINKQTYDKNFFDVHVLVKDSNDQTINLAKTVNGIVHVVPEQKCKGDALDVCLKKILKTNPDLYDAYLIVDADCLLQENCLEEMNNALASGRQIIQAKKVVKNYLCKNKGANNMVSACNGLIWTIIDDMGNRYKSDNKITNMTIGTGIMIRSDVIKKLGGWPYKKTLTEDVEFMYDCVNNDFTTFYYSHAIIYVEESTNHKTTNKRRTRWLTGVVDSKRLYEEDLKNKASNPKYKKNVYFTTALSLVFFYIGSIVLFSVANLFLVIPLFFNNNILWIKALLFAGSGMLLIYVSFFILTCFCLVVDHKHIKLPFYKKIMLLFIHPLFYMEYIPIIARAILSKNNRGWEIIERMDFSNDHSLEEHYEHN